MMSYVWIFVLGSLIVTGVKMQEDGLEVAENGEAPADDLAETVPDEVTDAESPTKETVDEATDPTETEAEETQPEPDAADVEPSATETPAAEEKSVEEEAPVEAVDNGNAPETGPDPPAEETEQEIEPEKATDEVEKKPEPESLDQKEPDQEKTDQEKSDQEVPEPDQEKLDQEKTDQGKPDQGEPEPDQEEREQDSGVVTEESVKIDEAPKVHSRGFDLSDAFSDDIEEVDIGDADKQSADHGKARSAGAASGPKDSGSATVVGVVCGIAVAAVGAITGYFTYQKKKLCFKVQRGDPESAKEENGTQSDPQVSSTLLDSP
ncbi:uncharacterized protein LOC143723734 isoform X4 [Siphateles boraxobius]|uniref:uncharacterized protein LOC143723734 isoform X4 n=1 Tax=Siphateles boraxobius TaxID=180520 RepID=UPI004064B3D0